MNLNERFEYDYKDLFFRELQAVNEVMKNSSFWAIELLKTTEMTKWTEDNKDKIIDIKAAFMQQADRLSKNKMNILNAGLLHRVITSEQKDELIREVSDIEASHQRIYLMCQELLAKIGIFN